MGKFTDESIKFTGKLGVVCGQGWRDISVIKSMPYYTYQRTLLQGECRTIFSYAVLLSKLANKILFPPFMFSTPKQSYWNGRIKQATINIKNGLYGLSLLPVIQEGFTNYDTIESFNLSIDNVMNDVIIKVIPTQLLTNKLMSVALLPRDFDNLKDDIIVMYGRFKTNSNDTIIIDYLPGKLKEIKYNAIICTASRDNENEKIIYGLCKNY